MAIDLLIEGGTLVDGTGAAGRPGSVAIEGDRLRLLDTGTAIDEPVGRRIDAGGKVVAPGFIDLHSHSGLTILAEPRHEPKVRQGVTSEVIGVDGLSYAPLPSRADLEALVEMNAGLDGAPPDVARDWDSVAEYLARFDGRVAVNIGLLVGNSALRIGRLGWDDVPADEAALADMRAMLADAMAAGALGLSSGLDYPPGSYATTDELATLTAEAARHGGFYHTHVRYMLGDRFLDPFREAIDVGRRGPGPVHLTHFYHRRTHPGAPEQMLALVDDAHAAGIEVTFDSYPYEWASTRLLIQLPQWVQAGGLAALKERLADDAIRQRIRAELRERGGAAYTSAAGWADVRLGAFTRPQNLRWEGRALAEVMAERGVDAVDAICDLLLEEDLRVNQVTTGPWKPTMEPFFRHPAGMVGTDSTFVGAKPSPRTYGSYPRVLGEFVREDHWLGLEEAIRRMTSAPAERLGLRDRGRLADGLKADVVVFDPHTVRSNATYDEPRQFPDGIEYVLVNGVVVVDGGAHTGELPGRTLRR